MTILLLLITQLLPWARVIFSFVVLTINHAKMNPHTLKSALLSPGMMEKKRAKKKKLLPLTPSNGKWASPFSILTTLFLEPSFYHQASGTINDHHQKTTVNHSKIPVTSCNYHHLPLETNEITKEITAIHHSQPFAMTESSPSHHSYPLPGPSPMGPQIGTAQGVQSTVELLQRYSGLARHGDPHDTTVDLYWVEWWQWWFIDCLMVYIGFKLMGWWFGLIDGLVSLMVYWLMVDGSLMVNVWWLMAQARCSRVVAVN